MHPNPPSQIPSSDVPLTLQSGAVMRCTWVSIFVNLGLATGQVMIGFIARSQGLIADGIHSLSDLVADFIVLLATRHGIKDADEDHPYGHHRFVTGASLALGLMLIVVAAGMLSSAVQRLQVPSSIPRVQMIGLWAAVGALVTKEILFRFMLAVAKRARSSLLVANAWHARSDAASSLVVAIGILGNLLGYPILDPIAAFVVGLLIAKMGIEFAWRAFHDLMDASADLAEVEAIRDTLVTTPGVRGVHDLRTRKMGDLIAVDAHLEVDGHLTVEEGHEITVEARNRVMERHRVLDLMTHLDPFSRPDRDHAPRSARDSAAG
jgi:cation diffusion facilitator family transporter